MSSRGENNLPPALGQQAAAASEMLKKVLVRSHDVIAHPIEDELVVISIPRHPGELGKGALSLNRTARDIWEKLDGTKTLMQVVKDISEKAD